MSTQVSSAQTSTKASTSTQTKISSFSQTTLQTMAAIAFGAVVLFAVGFLPTDAAHNAAHDTRHAMAFPCH